MPGPPSMECARSRSMARTRSCSPPPPTPAASRSSVSPPGMCSIPSRSAARAPGQPATRPAMASRSHLMRSGAMSWTPPPINSGPPTWAGYPLRRQHSPLMASAPRPASARFGVGHATGSRGPTPPPRAAPPVSPSPSPSPTVTVTPSPTPTPGARLAQDTFQHPNQAHSGTASDGNTWGGDANTQSVFSISNNMGQVSNGSGIYSAVLGPTASNAAVLFTGSMSSFSKPNLGGVLRWTDANNLSKTYIDGTNFGIQVRANCTN